MKEAQLPYENIKRHIEMGIIIGIGFLGLMEAEWSGRRSGNNA